MSSDSAVARILVVDDEPFNRDLLQQELEDLDYAVELASDGREALETVGARRPDIILMDVIMPRLDGIETCRILKDNLETAHIPVIIMTALTAVEDRIRGIQAGADDFLSKPVDHRELIARIETALRTKRAVERTRGELANAANQLSALSRIDHDATVVVVTAESAEAIRRSLVDAGARELASTDRLARWILLDPDPSEHVLAAVRAISGIKDTDRAAIAFESGPVLVSTERVEQDADSRWETIATGSTADAAADIHHLAGPGQTIVGSEAARRLEGLVETLSVDGSDVRLLSRDVDALGDSPAESPTLPWPPEYGSLLEQLRDDWKVSGPIYLTRSLSGKSGARVYLVDITTKRFSGQAILKLDAAPQEDWGEEDEAHRHARAIDLNRAYADVHLPFVVHSLATADSVASLARLAGGGLEYVLPWAHNDFERQVVSASEISQGILSEWNTAYELSEMLAPSDLLTAWLGYRLDPEQGRIARFLEARGVESGDASFVYEGSWYPNPYAFATRTNSLPSRAALRAARGSIHGDLHGFNVLTRSVEDRDSYYLIDLALYEPDTFLLYDNAYFELAHLLHTRETARARRWLNLLASVQGRSVSAGDDYGLVQIVNAIRAGVRRWIEEYEPHRLAFMESQYALARVAAGLNFVNKRVSEQIKLLSLLYAAVNLKSYLEFQAIDWDRKGPTLAD